MIPVGRLILLDTNILLHLVRGRAAGQWIDGQYQLRARIERPLISAVTVGELLRIAARGTHPWGGTKHRELQNLLGNLLIIGLEGDVLAKYGELGAYLDAIGRPTPQNDVWIAATAAAKGAVLLTTDTDFDPLHPTHLEREYVDPRAIPSGPAT